MTENISQPSVKNTVTAVRISRLDKTWGQFRPALYFPSNLHLVIQSDDFHGISAFREPNIYTDNAEVEVPVDFFVKAMNVALASSILNADKKQFIGL